ncbi:MAG: GNAT family N-acetyltransferase [Bacteroidetes bacterium]|nr:MAG: GNAT family N-acetyltransferase [Bacteroidota bacterium]
MALKIIDHGTHEYRLMLKLREDLLRKPLGISFTKEELEKEKSDVLIGAFDDDDILGCCMLVEMEPGVVRLRQLAVLNNLQGKGVGTAILQFSENLARDLGYKKITMHARKNTVDFFEKLGYQTVGEEFIEITIPHFEMHKEL